MPQKRDIPDRISDSFDNNDLERTSKYLDLLRQTMSGYTADMRRNGLLMLLLVGAFELVDYSKNTQITVASFSLHKGSVVLQFIPALVSYLYLQLVVCSTRLEQLGDAFIETFQKWSPKAYANDLGELVVPPTVLYWAVGQRTPVPRNRDYRRTSIENSASAVFFFAIIAGLIAFNCQAYLKLYRSPFNQDILWLISLAFSVFCIIMFAADLIAFVKELQARGPELTGSNKLHHRDLSVTDALALKGREGPGR
jgi:hypothetical protein